MSNLINDSHSQNKLKSSNILLSPESLIIFWDVNGCWQCFLFYLFPVEVTETLFNLTLGYLCSEYKDKAHREAAQSALEK